MDKKQLMAGTLAALTVASALPTTALAVQVDQEKTTIPYAVLAMHNEDEGSSAIAPFAEMTIQEQINAAEDGVQTRITLQGDLSEDVTIPAEKNILLDLNGHKLTNVSGNTINNNGTLTIEGTGTVDNISHGKAAIKNNVGGTVTLNDGSYIRSKENGQSASASGGNSYYNIVNWGDMTINDGVEVSQTGHFSSVIENGFQNGNGKTTSPKLTINGGSFSGGLNTVKNDDRGVLEIKGGTFTNVSQAAVLNWNDATIDGGSFQANAGAQAVVLNGKINDTMNLGKLTINGGSFSASGNGTVIQEMTNGAKSIGTVEINDGTFASESGKIIGLTAGNEDAAQINIVKGSFSTSDETAKAALAQYVDPSSEFDAANGTVTELPAERAEASVGAKNYATFAAAVAAAQAGDTIQLKTDVTTADCTEIRKALTIDFGTHKLTSNGGGLDIYADLTLKNGTLNAAKWCVWVQNGATVDIAKDMTLNADLNTTETNKPAVVVEGSTAKASTVNIEGTVTAINNFAVSGNGSDGKGNVVINIKDGANISSNETAVYMPNTWKLNITGGTITGATGVYIKSGTTSITGGTIIGTAAESNYEYKNGGANATGQAVVIDKCGYPGGDPTVEISGGSFVAEKASTAIGSYTGGSDTSGAAVEKFVTGGSFSASLKDTGFLADSLKAELQATSGTDPFSYYATVEAAKAAKEQIGGGTVTDLADPAQTIAASIGVKNYNTLAEAIEAAQSGDVIVLKQDVTESVTVPAGKETTLDLAGKNIESDSAYGTVVSEGKLTVKDSTATAKPVVNDDHTVTYVSGKITNTNRDGSVLRAANGGEIILESGSVESTSNIGVYAQGNYTPDGAAQNSKITVKGGYVLAQECAASAQGNDAELDIQGGVLEAKDNAVISGNGTKTSTKDCGGTTMNISGGTMIGAIQSAGYIACGVYHPQQGELNITGGKFLIKDGVGVLVRAGSANITGGEIITSGNASGKIGDSKIYEDCYGVVYDTVSDYPGAADTDKITIGGTAKIVTNSDKGPVYMRREESSTENKIGVTGGTFSAPVDKEYLEGLNAELKASTGDAPYSYYASLDEANAANEQAGGTGTVNDLREVYTVTLKLENGEADQTQSVRDGDKITLAEPTRSGRWKFLHWVDDNQITYSAGAEYTVTANVTLTAVWESTERTITLKYEDGATADGSIAVAVNEEITLPTPTRTGNWKFLHWTDGTNTYVGGSKYTVTENATLTAVWESTALTITLNYDNNGETQTETRAAELNDVIVLPTPTRSGRYTFQHWTDGTNTYAGGSNYTVTGNATLTAVWRYIGSSSSSSGSYNPSYAVSVPSRIDNGSVSVTPGSASKGTTVTITVKPDSGYELDSLTVTDQSGNRLSLSDKGDGKYTFTMPSGKVSVDASFAAIRTAISFRDVQRSDYFYDAVQWAVEKNITAGTSANTFSPNASCTRAQMVTFLWRAAGSPAPKSTNNPFRDVHSTDYYYDAVLWAVENGITSGTGADTFAPNATVTRGQTVTFLYRAAGSPAAGGSSGFSDVDSNDYYNGAVAWAAENGITGGTGNGKFSPNADCTRGQIVTLLYRANN